MIEYNQRQTQAMTVSEASLYSKLENSKMLLCWQLQFYGAKGKSFRRNWHESFHRNWHERKQWVRDEGILL